ncbi:MAG: hypothetical protein H6597_02980 [Flavobacteriales bacterium]|nr:hypothetical protein [Flavobacteriales bacterium]MCB9193470.1 hypothetical protein [Flavobacteriales bacterium]
MKWLLSIRTILFLGVLFALNACTKEELAAPAVQHVERSIGATTDPASMSHATTPEEKGPGASHSLRSTDEMGDGGSTGISDDGDDEADSERNRKVPH